MTITHTDGYPVQPVDAQSPRIGMGERYDVLVQAGDGVFPGGRTAGGQETVTAWRFCAVPRAARPPIPFLPSSPPTRRR